MKTSLKLVLAMSLVACCCSVASADILYSNITSTFPTGSPGGVSLAGPEMATTFKATKTGNLTDLMLMIFSFNGPTPGTVGLYTDSSLQPGTLLESWSTSLQDFNNNPLALTDLTSVTNPLITAGTRYWVTVTDQPTNNAPSWGWITNNTHVTGGVWVNDPPFDVRYIDDSTPGVQLNSAPEPGYLVLLGAGMGALVFGKRRLHRQSV